MSESHGRAERSTGGAGPDALGVALLLLAVPAVLVAYAANLRSGPFLDDLGWVRLAAEAAAKGAGSVWGDAFGCFFFRPLNILLLIPGTRTWSWILPHAVALAVHLALAAVVGGAAARASGRVAPRRVGLLAGGVFLIHPAAAPTVLQLDTLSQSTSDFFAVLAVLAAARYAGGRSWSLALSSAACLAAMLGKEGGVSAPAAAVCVAATLSPPGRRLARGLCMLAGGGTAAIAYLLWRGAVRNLAEADPDPSTRYVFSVGAETLRNLAEFAFVQGSPCDAASLLWHRRPFEWVLAIGLGAAAAAVTVAGWRTLGRREPTAARHALAMALVVPAWCAPYVFLARVSEQEVYRLVALSSAALAVGFSVWWESAGPRARIAGGITAAIWIAIAASATVQKADLLRRNAAVSTAMTEATAAALGSPAGVEEVWVRVDGVPRSARVYSVFHVPDALLRGTALIVVPEYVGRPGIRMRYAIGGGPVPPEAFTREGVRVLRVDVRTGRVEVER